MQNTPIVRIQPKAYWQLAVVIALFFSWFIIWENVKAHHHFATDELVYTKSLFSDVTYQNDYEREPSGNKVAYHTISTPDRLLERVIPDESNHSTWSMLQSEVQRLLQQEQQLVFFLAQIVYFLLCALICRRYRSLLRFRKTAFMLCGGLFLFFCFSAGNAWLNMGEARENISLYVQML
ncbi:hypothetical protein AAFJ72_05475 [Brevibacillus gelatini]|uniref:hypothetical protein n=1 Tax=Brevibacillus gelatini TaxID=1655277 RepID=UPI003D81844C